MPAPGSGSSVSAAYFTPIDGIVTIDFTDFAGGDANLSDVDSIKFLFDSNGSASRNAFLTQVLVVPEPAATALVLAKTVPAQVEIAPKQGKTALGLAVIARAPAKTAPALVGTAQEPVATARALAETRPVLARTPRAAKARRMWR